jgi:para-aminobenzoate synthetase/4-amino-4-deoxychorismate lyase
LGFREPVSVLSCFHPGQLEKCFEDLERELDQGHWAAGYLTFEAGYALERKLKNAPETAFPLFCFGLYPPPEESPAFVRSAYTLSRFRLGQTYEQYEKNIQVIRDYIAAGDVYQITYCLKAFFDFEGDPLGLFRTLLEEQPVPYAAYLEEKGRAILSLSPEMFLKKEGSFISTKPMKGTWPRGEDEASDWEAKNFLENDPKNRAENIMIVDLMRNDLGKVGKDVQAPRLFEVTPYKTLFQMTSTVTSQIDPRQEFLNLMRALFPSGSVTGAPKIRAMEVLRELEGEDRRIYTGTIGYITPQRDMYFNIPIRTLLIEGGKGEMGIGGGIVWDSTPKGEWAEGLLKAKFFSELFR